MPLTFPAHQAPVLPLKLWRPQLFDGTALCVSAAAPDLAYPLGSWLGDQSHTAIGVALWAIPATVLTCAVLRWRAAAGVFAHLPDGGPLRLRSYRVLARRRPPLRVTVLSALLGSVSHVVIDGFTHEGRWGAAWLGLDRVVGELPLRGELTGARALQYLGHTGGSVVALTVLAGIGHRRLLERWYGHDAVTADRRVAVSPLHRLVFWTVALLPPFAVASWTGATGRNPTFATIAAATAGLLAAGTLPLHRDTPA
jgi:hypothetical protein